MKPVRLEPAAPRSRVKHSTTEQLRSLNKLCQEVFKGMKWLGLKTNHVVPKEAAVFTFTR